MDITPELTIDRYDERFFAALEDPSGFTPHLQEAMQTIMTEFVARAEIPAPESEANSPGRTDAEGRPIGYYERGRGWWYPVLTHNSLGLQSEIPSLIPHPKAPHTLGVRTLRAKGFARVAGYKLIPSSEQLEENWQANVQIEGSDVLGHLNNSASYASYVQGYDQIRLHRRRNWQTVEDTWASEPIQETVATATMNALDEYYHLTGG